MIPMDTSRSESEGADGQTPRQPETCWRLTFERREKVTPDNLATMMSTILDDMDRARSAIQHYKTLGLLKEHAGDFYIFDLAAAMHVLMLLERSPMLTERKAVPPKLPAMTPWSGTPQRYRSSKVSR